MLFRGFSYSKKRYRHSSLFYSFAQRRWIICDLRPIVHRQVVPVLGWAHGDSQANFRKSVIGETAVVRAVRLLLCEEKIVR